eukprot:TRINITY_DN5871_c0_g1_i2.p1 TRINITY_DN5871_c0_g1~~TRINITY_DN5871_c0_g1_i2.p1  ORF type:complete len:335 (+),score=37.98 TRINITY_DN5871_c0_g1_i2:306-1310(+)
MPEDRSLVYPLDDKFRKLKDGKPCFLIRYLEIDVRDPAMLRQAADLVQKMTNGLEGTGQGIQKYPLARGEVSLHIKAFEASRKNIDAEWLREMDDKQPAGFKVALLVPIMADDVAFFVDPSLACRGCEKKGVRACAGCHSSRYCSTACQKADWKRHKVECQKKQAELKSSEFVVISLDPSIPDPMAALMGGGTGENTGTDDMKVTQFSTSQPGGMKNVKTRDVGKNDGGKETTLSRKAGHGKEFTVKVQASRGNMPFLIYNKDKSFNIYASGGQGLQMSSADAVKLRNAVLTRGALPDGNPMGNKAYAVAHLTQDANGIRSMHISLRFLRPESW